MSYILGSNQGWAEEASRVLTKQIDSLFNKAPVMMHSIDADGRIIKVNRRWLRRMGYRKNEVIGQRSIDFLDEESRRRAMEDTLPLFWRAGSARSVGYRFVRKSGRVLDALLDAEAFPIAGATSCTLATIREGDSLASA